MLTKKDSLSTLKNRKDPSQNYKSVSSSHRLSDAHYNSHNEADKTPKPPNTKELQNNGEIELRPVWTSGEITLDDFVIKEQKFSITAWLNMHYYEKKSTFIRNLRREFYRRTEETANDRKKLRGLLSRNVSAANNEESPIKSTIEKPVVMSPELKELDSSNDDNEEDHSQKWQFNEYVDMVNSNNVSNSYEKNDDVEDDDVNDDDVTDYYCDLCGKKHPRDEFENIDCTHDNMEIYEDSNGDTIIKILNLIDTNVFLYDLPVDPRRIFDQNSYYSFSHFQTPRLYYSTKTQVVHVRYSVKAELYEHLELYAFPFDREFLNIKLRWNPFDNYRFLGHFTKKDQEYAAETLFGYNQNLVYEQKTDENVVIEGPEEIVDPITVRLRESMAHELHMLPPFIDFRTFIAEENEPVIHLKNGLIRLRVQRKPWYHVFNIIFPVFCIVSGSFAIFASREEAVTDRLGLSIGILMAFTSYQSAINDALPSISQMSLIHIYIALAYFIQMMLLICSCVISKVKSKTAIEIIDTVFLVIFLGIWLGFTIFYMMIYSDKGRQFLYKSCHNKCTKDLAPWGTKAKMEIKDWNDEKVQHIEQKYYKIDKPKRDERALQVGDNNGNDNENKSNSGSPRSKSTSNTHNDGGEEEKLINAKQD